MIKLYHTSDSYTNKHVGSYIYNEAIQVCAIHITMITIYLISLSINELWNESCDKTK